MRLRHWGAALLALSLTAAACGSDDDSADSVAPTPITTDGTDATDAPDETTAPGGTAATSDAPSDTPAPTDPPSDTDPDATFRFGDTLPITTLDPHKATGGGYNVWLFPVYDRLVHVMPEGQAAPGLATEWSFSDDGLTLSLTLREGVSFTDGTPFDAEAVKANIERGQTLETSAVKGDLGIFTAVTVVDPTHVDLTLAAANATAPLVLSERAGAIASPTAFDTLDLQPVGTGMYTVSAFEPSVSATYERNADYWEPEAVGVATMEFTTIADGVQRANALKTGDIDATILDASQVADVTSAGITVDSAPNLQFFHLQLNRTRAGFDNPLVRQALNYAIDRQAIVDGLLFGLADIAVQPFPDGAAGHNDEVGDDFYTYDPAKAEALLEEAGATDLAFTIVTLNIPSYVQLAEAVQAQLGDVGIDVTIEQVTNVSQAFYVDATGDSTVIQWTGRLDPSITVQQLFTDQGFSNPGRHTTPEVMALQTEALATTDPAARAEILSELTGQITDDALDVVLYFPYYNLAYNENVVGFQNWLSGKIEFRGVAMKG